MNNFSDENGKRLAWEPEGPSKSINFLDLTIMIDKHGRLQTKTYQKPMNLYLYVPSGSAHPPGGTRALVLDAIRRYYAQNSNPDDFISMVRLLFERLHARGYATDFLKELFAEAAQRLVCPPSPRKKLTPDDMDHTLFLHMQYHPHALPRHTVKTIYKWSGLESALQSSPRNQKTGGILNIDRAIIAYNRAPNIDDFAVSRRLQTRPGQCTASSVLERIELT
jgi:hypothetical protein